MRLDQAIDVNCKLGGWFYVASDVVHSNYDKYKVDGDGLVVTSRNYQQSTWHSFELTPDQIVSEWAVELDDGTTILDMLAAAEAGYES